MHIEVLRLSPGDDLRAALDAAFAQWRVAHGIDAACIVSAVGSLSHAVLRYAAEPAGAELHEALEIISLSGTLSPDGAHLHCSVAGARGDVKGGHLMPGCIVRTTAEVVVALLPGWEFRRELDAATGYNELSSKRQ
ncbi:MAG: DNA-binding protein [Burkholderiales bacterium]|nr:DNA-binding protein [Burkholderiales bacterium]